MQIEALVLKKTSNHFYVSKFMLFYLKYNFIAIVDTIIILKAYFTVILMIFYEKRSAILHVTKKLSK